MMEIILDSDERRIAVEHDVTWIGVNPIELDKLTLTNKAIYLSYAERTGLFSKADRLAIIPLSNIDFDSIATVRSLTYGHCLKIEHTGGTEKFGFEERGKQHALDWGNDIRNAIIMFREGSPYSEYEMYVDESGEMPVENISDVFDSDYEDYLESEALEATFEPVVEKKITVQCMGCGAPLTGVIGDTVRCEYCDIEQVLK